MTAAIEGVTVTPAGTSDGEAVFSVSRNDSMAMEKARPVPQRRKTTLFDKLDMRNKPPPEEIGLSRIVEDSRSWWPQLSADPTSKRVIDLDATRAFASKLDDSVPTVVDFEDVFDARTGRVRELRLDIRAHNSREVSGDVAIYRQLLRTYREGGFTGKLGMYAGMPVHEVNWNILKRDPMYAIEQRLWSNASWFVAATEGLLKEVDFVTVSLYAIGPDVNQHLEWCEAMIEHAKVLGKPVVAYISPESHWAATGGFARTMLQQPQWQGTLELIRRKEVDAVLWLGGDNRFKHDFAEAPMWWQVFEALRNRWASESMRTR